MVQRGSMIGIAVLVLLLTFTFLDAGALAWSASFITGPQLAAELVTFFVLVSGTAITFWKMRA